MDGMSHDGPGVVHYVSCSAERGQVKTSCSVHYSAPSAATGPEVSAALAEAMARSIAVAGIATQTMQTMLTRDYGPEVIAEFTRRVNDAALSILEGRG